jgi:hypothetical protein
MNSRTSASFIVYINPSIKPGKLVVACASLVRPLYSALGAHAHLFYVDVEAGAIPGTVVRGSVVQVAVGDEGTARNLRYALANPDDLKDGLMRLIVGMSRYDVPDYVADRLVEKFLRLRRQVKWRDHEIKWRDELIRRLRSRESIPGPASLTT